MLDEYNQLFITDKNIIRLSDCETMLLVLLLKNKNKYTPINDIIRFVHHKEADEKSYNALVAMKYRLNKKLHNEEYLIIGKKCKGYRFIYKKEGNE